MTNTSTRYPADQLQILETDNTKYAQKNSSMFSIVTVAGTRPELIKLSEFIRLFDSGEHGLLYTGQHFSPKMKDIFLEQLGIFPDFDSQMWRL